MGVRGFGRCPASVLAYRLLITFLPCTVSFAAFNHHGELVFGDHIEHSMLDCCLHHRALRWCNSHNLFPPRDYLEIMCKRRVCSTQHCHHVYKRCCCVVFCLYPNVSVQRVRHAKCCSGRQLRWQSDPLLCLSPSAVARSVV